MKKIVYLIFLLMASNFSYALHNCPLDTVLILKHKTKDKVKYIPQGKKITYWKHDDVIKTKGRIQNITDSSFYINGKEVKFSELRMVGAKTMGAHVAQVSGEVVLVTGTLVSAFGAYLIYYGKKYTDPENEPCETAVGSMIFVFMGIATTVVGVPLIIVGGIPVLLAGKHYDLLTKWTISTTVIENKSKSKKEKIQIGE